MNVRDEKGHSRTWVVVNHDGLLAHLLKSEGCANCTPIEFNRRTDSVNAGSKNDSSVVIEGHVVSGGIVGGVEIL